MKEVIFVILEGFADWEGAYIATCLNQGVKPGNPISYKVKTLSITQEPVSSIGGFRVLPDYENPIYLSNSTKGNPHFSANRRTLVL